MLGLYWTIGRNRIQAQNIFLIIASYYFYAQWDYRFLVLIAISTVLDYLVGLGFLKYSSPKAQKRLLWTSLVGNLGILFYFKYFNFFVDSFIALFDQFGVTIHSSTALIILPVGISFYTFQTLSYTVDIYRQRLKPTTDFIAFTAFVSFFPQLVAGPIERARNFLPQFQKVRQVHPDQLKEGFDLILWGLFKKLVIADNIAPVVNRIYDSSDSLGGSTLFVGAFLFLVQLYLDFSAYSDIAIGVSRFFGFRLMRNFAYPCFARDVAESWSRWHISLTTWFRDYIFIPLTVGRSDNNLWKFAAAIISFGLCGLWHGAAWNFVGWGLLIALMYSKHIFFPRKTPRTAIAAEGKLIPSLVEVRQIVLTLVALTVPSIFFRSQSIEQVMDFFWGFASMSMFEFPSIHPSKALTGLIVLFFLIEWVGRHHWSPLTYYQKYPFWVQWSVYQCIIALTWYYRALEKTDFIYFQF